MQQHPAMGQQPAPPRAPVYQVPGMPPSLPPGTVLFDRYLIQGYIGGGGFGHIYKALDNALGFRRAIKEAFYQDPLTRRQFHLEAEFLLNIHHPNLVSGYAVFEQAGRLYLVMDYVDGHTLEEIAIDHIRRTGWPLPEARVLDWIIPVCGALHALHSTPVPVIHRDVKPANVKVNRMGVPVLIDLGLAKLYAPGTQTIGAALAFTPGYAPPEQYQASGATDARTDLYGMGASLFYLLTGYQPTEAPARIGSLAVPPLRQLNPHLSPLTERTVLRAMELLPQNRQQSALELERELRAALAALPDAPASAIQAGAQAIARPCQSCGALNPGIARHCMHCGTRLAGWQTRELPHARSTAGQTAAQAAASDADRQVHTEPVAEPEEAGEAVVSVYEAELEEEVGARTGRDSSEPQRTPDESQVGAPVETDSLAEDGAGPADRHLPQPPVMEGATGSPALAGMASSNVPPAAAWDAVSPAQTDLAADAESAPDQPAMVIPPLRRGPAPAAMPLHASGGHGESARAPVLRDPLWHTSSAEKRALTPNGTAPVSNEAIGAAPAPDAPQTATPRPQSRAALARRSPVSILRQWQAVTLAAAPPDDAEARAAVAAIVAAVLAVAALQGVHTWATLGAALATHAWLSLSSNVLLPIACAAGALALGHWCLKARVASHVREVRWLARLALAIAYVWLALYVVGTIFVALHAR